MEDVRADMTLNVEGLWLLQALLGISVVAPEIRGLPYGPAGSDDWIAEHPGVRALREAGIVDESGNVGPEAITQMHALAAPDVEVAILCSAGPLEWSVPMRLDDSSSWRAVPEGQLRIVLARKDDRWVSAARVGQEVTIDTVEGLSVEALADLVLTVMDSVHVSDPASIAPLNLPLEDIASAAAQRAGLPEGPLRARPLTDLGVKGAALADLEAVLDDPLAEAVFYARAYVDTEVRHSESVLNLRDTIRGRVASYRMPAVVGSRQSWMTFVPGTHSQVEHAVKASVADLGLRSWERHTRM